MKLVKKTTTSQVAAYEGLSPMEFAVLEYLKVNGEDFSFTQCAKEFGKTAPTVRKAVTSLEQKGRISKVKKCRYNRWQYQVEI